MLEYGRVYFFKIRPYSSTLSAVYDWSHALGLGLSELSSHSYSDKQIDNKYKEALNSYKNKYPYTAQTGNTYKTYTTIESVESASLNSDQKADFIGRVICGDSKLPQYQSTFSQAEFDTWQGDFSTWRGCLAASYHMLNMQILWDYINNNAPLGQAKETITRNSYFLISQLDILLAKKGELPFAGYTNTAIKYPDGAPNANYTLGENQWSKEYITDFGMGVLKSLGWAKKYKLINRTYCSYYEGQNNSCKNVDLYDRIKKVTAKLYAKELNELRSNASWTTTYRKSRHLAGMMMAAKLNADILEDEEVIYKEAENAVALNMDFSNLNDPAMYDQYRIPSDYLQHHATIHVLNDWQKLNSSSHFITDSRGNTILRKFYDAYWLNNKLIVDKNQDSYDLNLLSTSDIDTPQIGECKQTNILWHKTSINKLVGLRGEPPSSALLTSIPAAYHIADAVNPYVKNDIRATLYSVLDVVIKNPSHYSEESCYPSAGLGTMPLTDLSVTLRQTSFMILCYLYWNKIPIAAF